jgi:hypothetical protein
MNTMLVPAGLLQFAATLLAVFAARRRKAIWPIAGMLVLYTVADLLSRALEFTNVFSSDGPYTGIPRLVFHADQALFLCWPFALLAAVMIVLYRRTARWLLCPAIGWVVAVIVACLCYPTLRGAKLQNFYFAIELFTVTVTTGGFTFWWITEKWLTRPGPEIAALLLILFIDAAGTFGPFLNDLFFYYEKIQALNIGLYSGLILIHGGFLLWAREPGRADQAGGT